MANFIVGNWYKFCTKIRVNARLYKLFDNFAYCVKDYSDILLFTKDIAESLTWTLVSGERPLLDTIPKKRNHSK
ncbi:hypothetical protein A9Q87_13570 [Flavobacteriales bacterium 34_180_T64]|nr:hypothetical protein A9Q87_13570 [Flavobacteriales bacterium 34_180_T64]